jgi:hypothetical protein
LPHLSKLRGQASNCVFPPPATQLQIRSLTLCGRIIFPRRPGTALSGFVVVLCWPRHQNSFSFLFARWQAIYILVGAG